MTEPTGLILVAGIIGGLLLAAALFVLAILFLERERGRDKQKDLMASFYRTANKETIDGLVLGLAAIEARQIITERDNTKLTADLYTRIDELKADLLAAKELIVSLNEQVAALTKALAKSEAE